MPKKRTASVTQPTLPITMRPTRLVIERQPDESTSDWEQTLDAIEADGLAAVTRQHDGSACITWPAGVLA